MIENRVKISETFGNRLDVSFYRERFDFVSKSYPSFAIQQLLEVNPSVSFKNIDSADEISFVPMEVIDEVNGIIAEQRTIKVSNTKGFTKFEDDDLLWAKITPCMQNGKSAVARNLINGVGCGSTEFFVLRPKSNNVLIEYVHYILRDKKVLESAKNSFGGSAGQQRVSSSYLRSIKIPLPPIGVQQRIVDIYSKASSEKRAKEKEAQKLLNSIDNYLSKYLGITKYTQQDQKIFSVKLSQLIGKAFDVKSNQHSGVEIAKGDLVEVLLDKVATLTKGKSITKDKIEEGAFPVIAGGQSSPYSHSDYNQEKNAITISASGAYSGYVWYHDYKFFASDCTVVRSKNEQVVTTNFIYLILKFKQDEIYRMQRGSGQPHVYSSDLAKVLIPLPSIEKQIEITNKISDIRAKALQLQAEATAQLEHAKREIEKIILG